MYTSCISNCRILLENRGKKTSTYLQRYSSSTPWWCVIILIWNLPIKVQYSSNPIFVVACIEETFGRDEVVFEMLCQWVPCCLCHKSIFYHWYRLHFKNGHNTNYFIGIENPFLWAVWNYFRTYQFSCLKLCIYFTVLCLCVRRREEA